MQDYTIVQGKNWMKLPKNARSRFARIITVSPSIFLRSRDGLQISRQMKRYKKSIRQQRTYLGRAIRDIERKQPDPDMDYSRL